MKVNRSISIKLYKLFLYYTYPLMVMISANNRIFYGSKDNYWINKKKLYSQVYAILHDSNSIRFHINIFTSLNVDETHYSDFLFLSLSMDDITPIHEKMKAMKEDDIMIFSESV